MSEPFNLHGRTVLVTGASRGIGLAMAHGLARQGARVAVTGRKIDTLQKAAAEVGEQAIPIACHQGEPASIQKLFAELERRQLNLDAVIINAATNPVFGPLLDTDLAAWQKIVDVNLTGSLVTAQLAARQMLPRKAGSIVFISSVAGIDPMRGIGAYSASKAGMLGLMRALAKELGPEGVRVNAIAPGLIETRFSTALLQDTPSYERFISQVPLGRHGQPDDVVGAALFLVSDASRYMTGQVLVVDGGSRM